VNVVSSRSVADLLVYQTESRSIASGRDEIWCLVGSRSIATSKVNFVGSRSIANLLVCYVGSRSVAGRQRDHPLRGKL